MKALNSLATVALLVAGSAAHAQPPQVRPENNTPAWTKSAPEMGDTASNPSTYEQINRLNQGLDAQGRPRDKNAAKGGTRPAQSAEITIGSEVRDKRNKVVGMIETVDAGGAIVATAAGKVKVPLEAFGTDGKTLVIGMTKAEFDRLVASAYSSPGG